MNRESQNAKEPLSDLECDTEGQLVLLRLPSDELRRRLKGSNIARN